MKTELKNLIIGAGPAGYVCAIRLAQLSQEVTVVEKDAVGGICLNRGCIPTKALLHYTHLIEQTKNLKAFGIDTSLSNFDWKKLLKHVASITARLRKGIEYLLTKNNVKLITGKAELTNSNHILVTSNNGTSEIIAERVIIATGSCCSCPSNVIPDKNIILTSDEALVLEKIPKSLIIIGAGAIGLEFASIYNRIGTKTTILELMPQILPGADKEIAFLLTNYLKKQGINIICNATIQKASCLDNTVNVSVKTNEQELALTAEKILVASGRKANLDFLNLKNINIALDEKGYIKVNEKFQTNIENIYAIGDITGPPLLAHKAMAQGISLAELLAGIISAPRITAIPLCIYTEPELAMVGLNEDEAANLNYDYIVAKVPLAAIGRAHTMNKLEGTAKIIVEKKSGIILGAQLLCPGASDLINELTLAINQKLPIESIIDTVHPHPTLGEIIIEAAALIKKKAIHVINR
ncbi:MAG: dihydrolipoyl dehydrogenase [candidate division WOR-3 bacterium]